MNKKGKSHPVFAWIFGVMCFLALVLIIYSNIPKDKQNQTITAPVNTTNETTTKVVCHNESTMIGEANGPIVTIFCNWTGNQLSYYSTTKFCITDDSPLVMICKTYNSTDCKFNQNTISELEVKKEKYNESSAEKIPIYRIVEVCN